MIEPNKQTLVDAVSEDLALFIATKESPEDFQEIEMLAWRSGYIAGYDRAKNLLSDQESEEAS